jgi:O-antigen/teichoic acid export membrane protein
MFNLKDPSRRKTVKILTIGNYSVMFIDIVQGLLFVPLYLNYIGERLYGLWLGTGGILAVLAFLDMGMASLTIQRVSREYGLKNYEGISKYFFGGALINSGFMSILLIAGIILSFFLENIFPDISGKEKELLTIAFQIALIGLILSLLNNTIEGTLNALQKPLMGKVFQLTGAATGIIVIYFMLMGEKPLLAIAAGTLTRGAISLFPNVIYLTMLFKKNNIALFNYDRTTLKDYLKLTPNLMLSKFGTSLVGNIEPTLINIFISPEVAVFYSVTKKVGGLIRSIIDRIGSVLYSSMSHLFSENKQKFSDLLMKYLSYFLNFSLTLFLIYFILNENFIHIWVGPENYLGDLMTILIATSLFLSSLSNITSYLLSSTGDIKYTSNSVFFESILKVILLYTLIQLLGVYGLPLAIIVSSLIFLTIYILRWQKHLLLSTINMKKYQRDIILSNLIIIVFAIPVYFISQSGLFETNIPSFLILAIFIFIAFSMIVLFTKPEIMFLFKNKIISKKNT